jgi:hypothetical protein
MEIASNNPTPLKPSQIVMEPIDGETTTKKRKKGSSNETTDLVVKKRKTGETIKPKRVPKPKVEKKKESVSTIAPRPIRLLTTDEGVRP